MDIIEACRDGDINKVKNYFVHINGVNFYYPCLYIAAAFNQKLVCRYLLSIGLCWDDVFDRKNYYRNDEFLSSAMKTKQEIEADIEMENL